MNSKMSEDANAKIITNKDANYNTTTKAYSKDRVLKVASGALFVLITELWLGLYIHQYMAREYNEIRDNFALKAEMDDYFLKLVKLDAVKDELTAEILKKIRGEVILSRPKRHNVSNLSLYCLNTIRCIQYFYLGSNSNTEHEPTGVKVDVPCTGDVNIAAGIQGPTRPLERTLAPGNELALP